MPTEGRLLDVIRTQVQLTGRQMEALKRLAAGQRISVAELVRRAVDALVEASPEASLEERRRRAMAASGRFASGQRDVSEKHDRHLGEAFGP